MIPLRDHNPTTIARPVVLITFIAMNVLVYLATMHDLGWAALSFGAIPFHFTGMEPEYHPYIRPEPFEWWFPFRAISSAFLHGGFLHILGNMWFLWVFGDNVEARLGGWRFAMFYLVSALAAVAAQVVSSPSSPVPMVGASGAVAGVLGAYMRLFPRARVTGLVPIGFVLITVNWSAMVFIGLWFAMQAISATLTAGAHSGTAWWAHIGGFVVGYLWAPKLAPKRKRIEWSLR